jgi:hypothetical protein
MTDQELAELISNVVTVVDNSNEGTIEEAIKSLIDAGITANMHVGVPQENFTQRMVLEWYAGSIINIVEKQSWFAVNSWINCCDKFTTLKGE